MYMGSTVDNQYGSYPACCLSLHYFNGFRMGLFYKVKASYHYYYCQQQQIA